ncbi:hypothetical protein BVRB_032510, partial [Beta vulgaris subsp. vulgaris]
MGEDTALAIRQIEADLSIVLGDDAANSQIQFDSSQSSIDILSGVLRWAKGRLQLNRLIIDNINPCVNDVNSKAAKLDECLERLGLSHADVNLHDKEELLSQLSSTAQLLSLKDCKIYS